MKILDFIVNYWPALLFLLILLISAIVHISNFLLSSKEQKLENLRQWAVYACALAEKELGSGTGQLKMRLTYDMFLSKFPGLAKSIPYETYKQITESALTELKQMLSTNPNINNIIIQEGENNNGNSEN